jgi:hypothetical protein
MIPGTKGGIVGKGEEDDVVREGLSASEMRDNLVRLAFGGDELKLQEFCTHLARSLPPDTAGVMRGSSVTGIRWEDGTPFDAEGPGTSDLDLTLVGGEVVNCFDPGEFYIPGVHSKPLCDENPDIAPSLVTLRNELTAMVGRPVNIQATKDWIMFLRERLMGQPYLTLIGKVEEG